MIHSDTPTETIVTDQADDSDSTINCLCLQIGRMAYAEALDIQLSLVSRCRDRELAAALVIVEHDPVITKGAAAKDTNLLLSEADLNHFGVSVVQTDRGGDVTYHGPGQIVAYPILDLRAFHLDVHSYLRKLEDVVIETLAYYGLSGERHGLAGVWVEGKKVCSIGIAIRRSVTYHGLALNVDPDMAHFSYINPCGLESTQVSSMRQLMKRQIEMQDVTSVLKQSFEKVFNVILTEE